MKGLGLFLAAMMVAAPVFAESGATKTPVAKQAFDCEYIDRKSFASGEVASWASCVSMDQSHYRLEGLTSSGEAIANLEYSVSNGVASLSVGYLGKVGEIQSEFALGALMLDSVYSDGAGKDDTVLGAQLAMAASECDDRLRPGSVESAFWSLDGNPAQGATLESVMAFFDDAATEEVARLLEKVFSDLAEDGMLDAVPLHDAVESYKEFGSVSSAQLSFGLLQDGLEGSADELQRDMSCALLGLQATGAIIGVMRDNPQAGVACSGFCGAALGCLAAMASGNAASIPTCTGALGSCLGCVGLGYSKNLAGCMRTFQSMY